MALGCLSRVRSGILISVFSILFSGQAFAARSSGVSVDGVWCRVSEVHAHTAFVYMTLSIGAEPADKLVGATTPIAGNVEMLAPRSVKGRERLEAAHEIELDAHAPTVLQPQGPHLILKGMRHPLLPGEKFLITLEFAKAGKREVMVKVLKQPPATGMPDLPKGVKLD
jgi:copper(I)-binding protein